MKEVFIGGVRVGIADSIGKGGEGQVYSLKGRQGQAVKIYEPSLRSSREEKVRAMVGEGLASRTDLIAYPSDIVSDQKGEFIGFVMRLVSGYRPMHELYSPKSRQSYFPNTDYRFLVRSAANVARGVGKVHETGCVIGDFNHSGVLLGQNATVTLIDADSFQLSSNGKRYPCVVGVPDFTPPELHGQNLATVERSISHDNFGLAVAIFHLLFMGRHPYSGLNEGPDISIGDAIAENRFAFSLARRHETRTTPPPGALPLNLFPKSMELAFEAAFGLRADLRPNAFQWVGVLTELEKALFRCGKVKSHYHPSNTEGCVWCKLSGQSGFDMFPNLSDSIGDFETDTAGTENAIQEILAFRLPVASELLPQVASTQGATSVIREAKKSKGWQTITGLTMLAGACTGIMLLTPLWFVWLAVGFWGWSLFEDRAIDTKPFYKAHADAEALVQRELNLFIQRSGLAVPMRVRAELDDIVVVYKNQNKALSDQLRKLKSNRESRQRDVFLDRFSVRHANILGIGPTKTRTLISFGIETASDVNTSAVRKVPGFGDVMTRKLVNWRSEKEKKFRYDRTPNAQDAADERALRAGFAVEKAKLETTIRNGLNTLRRARSQINSLPSKAKSERSLVKACEEYASAKQVLQNLGVAVPASKISLSFLPSNQAGARPQRVSRVSTPILSRSNPTANTPSCSLCGASMQKRSGRYGRFWGCSRYPSCRGTKKV